MNTSNITSNQHFLIRNRNMRNEILKQTDHYVLYDNFNKMTDEEKQQILEYRQALREFININKDKYLNDGISFINFPIAPNFVNVKIPKY